MEEDGKIVVEFQAPNEKKTVDEESSTATQDVAKTGTAQSGTSQNALAKSAIASSLINSGKQMLQNGLNIFPQITGNARTVNKINDAMNLGATAFMICQFPVGTIAGITNIGIQTINSFVNQRNQQLEVDILKERIGNSNINDSKWSYD